jgi:hypothetical protein
MESMYTGRKSIWRGGQELFAEVTVEASPCQGPTQVTFSAAALEALRNVFGADSEAQRQIVQAAVAVQIANANAARVMFGGASTSFHVEVVFIRATPAAGREAGALLSIAGMNAMGDCIKNWEQSHKGEGEEGKRDQSKKNKAIRAATPKRTGSGSAPKRGRARRQGG